MSPRLPTLTAAKLIKALKEKGFEQVRQSGSHAIFRHPDGRRATVPVHQGKDLGGGILRQIMRDADLEVEDLTRG